MNAATGRPGGGSFFIGCHQGVLDPRASASTVVAIDVIRATTTAITAAALGHRCLLVASTEEALARAAGLDSPLLAGEIGGHKPDGFDLQNSPVEVGEDDDRSRTIVLLSTSGTPLVVAAARAAPTYVACLRNAEATASHLSRRYPRIAILGADPRGRLRREDGLCAARVGAGLRAAGFEPEDSFTERTMQRWEKAPNTAILGGRSVRYLDSSGQIHDLDFILDHIDDLQDAFVISEDIEVVRAA